jgi:uncharacterized protein YceK
MKLLGIGMLLLALFATGCASVQSDDSHRGHSSTQNQENMGHTGHGGGMSCH